MLIEVRCPMVEIIGFGMNGRVGTALSPDVETSVKEWGKQIVPGNL